MKKQITFRNYEGSLAETKDYQKLHNFLVESKNTEYTYGRFDWMMTNWEYLEDQFLDRIGIWEEDAKIVAADLYDHSLDTIFPITLLLNIKLFDASILTLFDAKNEYILQNFQWK